MFPYGPEFDLENKKLVAELRATYDQVMDDIVLCRHLILHKSEKGLGFFTDPSDMPDSTCIADFIKDVKGYFNY